MIQQLTDKVNSSFNVVSPPLDALPRWQPASPFSSGLRSMGLGYQYGDHSPRFQRPDFPKFDGNSDPLAFINRCEAYFVQQRIAAEEQVWMASHHLEDTAQMWYLLVQQSEGTPKWRRFTKLLHLRFDPPPLSHDEEMHNLQTPIVAMSPAQKLELQEQPPAAVTTALPVAPRLPSQGLWASPTQPMALSAPPPPSNRVAFTSPAFEGRQVRRRPTTEMDDRRRQEKVELDQAALVVHTDDPLVSLHTIPGVCLGKTMPGRIALGGVSLLTLLNSGSAHSFVAKEAAAGTPLRLQLRGTMKITVVNGERVPCPGVYRTASFSIKGHHTCWKGVASFSNGSHASLLEEFVDVFATPSGRPPPRAKDHQVCWLLKKFVGIPPAKPPAMSPTWEDINNVLNHPTSFQLEDELILKGEGDVMWSVHGQQPPRDLHGQQPPRDLHGQQPPRDWHGQQPPGEHAEHARPGGARGGLDG
jgi:hypothetical protein